MTHKMGAPPNSSTPPADAPAAPRPRLGASWAFAAVLIVMMLVGGLLTWYIIDRGFRTAGAVRNTIREFAADVARPKFVISEVVVSAVEDAHRANKLVVLNAKINADVTRQEGSSSWGIYWGTNTARVLVTDARAQYYIDLSSIGTSDFVYDENAKTITVTIPRPKLDTQMIAIDPAKIQTLDLSGGWMRWNKRETWQNAVNELAPKVILEASRPMVRREAEEAGKEAMKGILSPLADTLRKDNITVEIQYRD